MEGITVRLLGGCEASLADGSSVIFNSDKDRALFVYLVVYANRILRRESLAGLLWPERSEASAHHSLSQAIYSLRQPYHEHGLPDPFRGTRQTVELHISEMAGLDFYNFDQLSSGCKNHLSHLQVDCKDCLECLEQASNLYQDEFCAGLSLKDCVRFEEWLRLQREIYNLKYTHTLDMLIKGWSDNGDQDKALYYAYKRVYQDPYDENSLVPVINLLVKQGKLHKASEYYEDFCSMLAKEMNATPSRELVERCNELLARG